jgi:hypothetical protein
VIVKLNWIIPSQLFYVVKLNWIIPSQLFYVSFSFFFLSFLFLPLLRTHFRYNRLLLFLMPRQPLVDLDLLHGVPRSHSCRNTTLGRTPLDVWSARRRDLYLTTDNTYKRQTYMSPAGFKPAIPASEKPETYALDRVATGIGLCFVGSK